MWLSIYTIAQLLILHKSLFFQDDKRKCNDLQTGCVNYFLLSGEKKMSVFLLFICKMNLFLTAFLFPISGVCYLQ